MGFSFSEEPEEDLPDWLGNLGTGGLETPGLSDEASSEPEPSSSSEELPDWLAAGADEDLDAPSEESEAEAPDWLNTIRESEGQAQEPEPQEETESADWLEPIRDQEGHSEPEMTSASAEEVGDDFMARIKAIKDEDDEEPDWLGGLGDESPEDLFGQSPETAQPEEEGAPDWVSGLESSEVPQQEDDEEVPAWLSSIGGEDLAVKVDDQEPAEHGAEDAALDWMSDLSPEQASAAQAVDEEFPGLPGEPGEGSAQIPDWIADMQSDMPAESAAAGSSAEAFGDWGDEISEAETLPQVSAFSLESVEGAEEVLGLEAGTVPSWLEELEPLSAEELEREETMLAEQESASAPAFEGGAEDVPDIAPAELPNWLQAMRPVDSGASAGVGAAMRTGEEERIGPLAGLSDVLPAEPEIVQFGKPPAVIAGLHPNEMQRQFSAMLSEMITRETLRKPLPPAAAELPQRFMRLGMALLAFVLLLLPVLFTTTLMPTPDPTRVTMPEEVVSVLDIVDTFGTGSTVLVAFDYQPALSAEMETVAATVINHMILNGTQLALISTVPTGPGQADHFMQTTQSQHDYATNRAYRNLGYVSGGTAALLSVASDPRGTLPLTFNDGSSVWAYAPLDTINTLTDFDAILVLTDDPDTARAWVEQLSPYLKDADTGRTLTPLLMVVNAQTEALVYPYTQTSPPQVDGLVAGMRGAAFYESRIQPGLVRKYWDAYAVGLALAVVMVGIGGGFNLFGTIMARRRGGQG